MKRINYLLYLFLCIGHIAMAQKPAIPASIPIYEQADMFAFRMLNGAIFPDAINYAVIDLHEYRGQYRDKLNIIYFKASSTAQQRAYEIQRIKQYAGYDRDFKVTSQEPGLTYSANKYLIEEDMINITFKSGSFNTRDDIALFAQRNNLTTIVVPTVFTRTGYSGIYIFKLNNKAEYSRAKTSTVKAAESSVSQISPFITNLFKAPVVINEPVVLPAAKTDEAQSNCTTNDPLFKYQWALSNDGSLYYQGNPANKKATADADAKVCDCWGSGYTGNGVTIGVLDGNGIQYTHADLNGKLLSGWNYKTKAALSADYNLTDANLHMVSVVSLINSGKNNAYGLSGVAPNAKVVPLLVDYTNGITFIDAFNDLLIRFPKLDILNMSFSMAAHDPVVQAALQNFTNNGRVNPYTNVAAGVILVASAGNSNTNATGFPAAYKEVLSVINSNPNDLRHNHVNGWGTSGGSTYGYSYDIAAPGTFMFVNAVTGKGTSGVSTDHNITGGTSISAPLVSGISALLLEKNRYISQADFYNKIRNSADKVNSNVYNYNANASYPGKAEEMGYGRINCIKALNLISLASEEVKFVNNDFRVSTLVQNNITVEYFGNEEHSVNYKVIDMYGKELVSSTMQISSTASIDVSTLSSGMYMLYFYNNSNQISGIFKVAKTN